MIHYVGMNDDNDLLTERFSADNQTFDKKTLKQLRNKYGIFFMNHKDGGVMPVRLFQQNGYYRVAIGQEDDGTIWFYRYKYSGQYAISFGLSWLESMFTDLTALKEFAESHPNPPKFFDSHEEYPEDYETDDE